MQPFVTNGFVENTRFDVTCWSHGCLVVEVKASESVDSNEQKLTEGVSRLILPGANLE